MSPPDRVLLYSSDDADSTAAGAPTMAPFIAVHLASATLTFLPGRILGNAVAGLF